MNYLVDSCIWIDFFGQKKHFKTVAKFLFNNSARVNEAILAELLPVARLRKEQQFIECITGVPVVPLWIDWAEVEDIQLRCLKAGLNKLGVLDIIIVQNAQQNNLTLFSTDKHMRLLCKEMKVKFLNG